MNLERGLSHTQARRHCITEAQEHSSRRKQEEAGDKPTSSALPACPPWSSPHTSVPPMAPSSITAGLGLGFVWVVVLFGQGY